MPRPFRRERNYAPATASQVPQSSPAAPLTPSSATPPAAPQAETREAIFLGRQAIFDAREKVCGYQLLLRSYATTPPSAPQTPEQSARLIVDTLNNFGVAAAMGDKLAFVNFPDQAIASDLVQLLPKAQFVLEYPSAFTQTERGTQRCVQLRTQDYKLARTFAIGDPDAEKLPAATQYVIYDLAQQNLQDIVKLDRAVKPHGVLRLVRNVNSQADFVACKAFHLDLYQGNYFAKPETLASRRLDPSRARVVDIFNLVMNKAEVNLIEDAFKHDVALCYSLLCYINSVGIGMQYKVASIRNAIMLLGYDFLWRWLSLLVYAGIDLSAAQRVLLHTAIVRGRLTELLGQMKLPEKDANLLFIVGNFSLLDALLGVPIAEAIGRLHLPEEATQALVRGEGRLAPYLQLALAFESNQVALAANLCDTLGIEMNVASQAHLSAIEWAGLVAK